jgi:hypothetical protein
MFEPTAGRRLDLATTDIDGALIPGRGPNILISNESTTIWAYLTFGTSGLVSCELATPMIAVEPGKTVPFTLPGVADDSGQPYDYVSGITSTGTTTVHISRGFGG